MSLSITFRPQKDLYAVNPPTAYDLSYYNSRWVAGHLPIQYKILNTKWPVNSDDDVDNICAVSDANGFAQINLCGTYETYVEHEYIKIEDSTNTAYNGIWEILDVINATTLTISAAFDTTATGTLQRYYNNYHNLVKVYAGIPQYHQYDSEDPMSLIATLKVTPNASNLSIADISGLIQAKLNCDNDLSQISDPNDLNAWTGFYIEYAESYDVSDGVEITQFTSEYIIDDTDDCNVGQLIANGDFPSNLDNWVNGASGGSWTWSASGATANKGGGFQSKKLYQLVNLLQGVTYSIQVSITNGEPGNSLFLSLFASPDTTLLNLVSIHGVTFSAGTHNVSINFTPAQDFPVFGLVAAFFGSTSQTITVDNVSATVSDCTYYGFAINGTRQFQNTIGGNFGDYVQNFNTAGVLNKFLTKFTSPVWFNGLYFDLSTIIPASTFDSTEDNQLYYYIKEYTEGGGFIQRQDETITTKDDGVYRLPISDLTLDTSTDNFDLQIYQLPTNKLTQGNFGTFEYTVDPAGSPPSDWDMSRGALTGGLTQSSPARTGSYAADASFGGLITVGEHIVWSTTGGFAVQANSDYIIEGWIRFDGTFTAYDDMLFALVPIGITETLRQSQTYSAAVANTWLYVKTVFNTGANTSVDIKAIATALTQRTGGGSVHYDDLTVKGPVENLSVIKNIKVDNDCTKQNIYLTWLNNLGGWEYYNFKAEKDYGVDMGSPKSITRDVLVNWDTDFINGETQDDFISVEANETITVRSQFMSLEELQAVLQIRYAIRAQEIRSDNSKVTVLVDKGSFKRYSDGDKLYAIEFDIKYPKIEIQTQ